MKVANSFVGADGSVRPQKNPVFSEIPGKFVTFLGRTESSAPTLSSKFKHVSYLRLLKKLHPVSRMELFCYVVVLGSPKLTAMAEST